MKDITKIKGLDKKWQEQILIIMLEYESDNDMLLAIEKINELTGLGMLYSSEVFKKLVLELLPDKP